MSDRNYDSLARFFAVFIQNDVSRTEVGKNGGEQATSIGLDKHNGGIVVVAKVAKCQQLSL